MLVRGVNWLGDAVMTTPAIRRLCERFPEARITLLTHEKLAELWQDFPGLSRIETFGDRDYPWTIGRRFRRQGFEVCLILPNSPRSALEAWLAGVPRRVGFATPTRNWLLTDGVRPPDVRPRKRSIREVKNSLRTDEHRRPEQQIKPAMHQLRHYLRLAAVLGCDPSPTEPRLELSLEQIRSAVAGFEQIQEANPAAKPTFPRIWLGLNLSAAYGPAKKWPIDRFTEVVRQISRRVPNCGWLNFGTAADWELGENLAKSTDAAVINLAGKTSLRQLMALLKSCQVLLSNDSGPMHLAAALGVKVVVPFGSTSPELTGPGLPGDTRHYVLRSHAPCSPCFRRTCPIDFRCMTGITVDSAVTAILAGLGRH
jgi:lipopolysaccharide heptosyltransferase II